MVALASQEFCSGRDASLGKKEEPTSLYRNACAPSSMLQSCCTSSLNSRPFSHRRYLLLWEMLDSFEFELTGHHRLQPHPLLKAALLLVPGIFSVHEKFGS
jgi:hypothetical protein